MALLIWNVIPFLLKVARCFCVLDFVVFSLSEMVFGDCTNWYSDRDPQKKTRIWIGGKETKRQMREIALLPRGDRRKKCPRVSSSLKSGEKNAQVFNDGWHQLDVWAWWWNEGWHMTSVWGSRNLTLTSTTEKFEEESKIFLPTWDFCQQSLATLRCLNGFCIWLYEASSLPDQTILANFIFTVL